MRGKMKNNFQPRSCRNLSLVVNPAATSSRANFNAMRNEHHKNFGTAFAKTRLKSSPSNKGKPAQMAAADGRMSGGSGSNSAGGNTSEPASEQSSRSESSGASDGVDRPNCQSNHVPKSQPETGHPHRLRRLQLAGHRDAKDHCPIQCRSMDNLDLLRADLWRGQAPWNFLDSQVRCLANALTTKAIPRMYRTEPPH